TGPRGNLIGLKVTLRRPFPDAHSAATRPVRPASHRTHVLLPPRFLAVPPVILCISLWIDFRPPHNRGRGAGVAPHHVGRRGYRPPAARYSRHSGRRSQAARRYRPELPPAPARSAPTASCRCRNIPVVPLQTAARHRH